MKLLKTIILNIHHAFGLPKFSRSSKIKIPTYKISGIRPTIEFQNFIDQFTKNIDLKHINGYVGGKVYENVNSNIKYNDDYR